MSAILSLFRELPPMEAVTGTCVACKRKPARIGWTSKTADVWSTVGVCDPCARLLESFDLAKQQAHAVAALQAVRKVAP